MVETIKNTFAEMFASVLLFVMSVFGTVLSWVGDVVLSVMSPLLEPISKMLPDPSGMGFRYVFEGYKFLSAWVDFDALAYVFSALLGLHVLFAVYRFVLFCFSTVVKLKQLLPFI